MKLKAKSTSSYSDMIKSLKSPRMMGLGRMSMASKEK